MILQELLKELNTSKHPIAKSLYAVNGVKVLAIGFLAGMQLKEHQTKHHAKLYILEGQVKFIQNNQEIICSQYEEVEILPNQLHHVDAIQNSLCLLTIG